MTTYAIGSVNGNYQALLSLLEKIAFNPEQDYLWFSGNLVNGGPDSLEILRFVKNLGKQAITVLGPQEWRLLGMAAGFIAAESTDTLTEVLNAADRDVLLKWLRQRALLHHDSKLNFTLVHAGIHEEWTLSKAMTLAYEVESVLSGSNFTAFLENRRQDQSGWHPKLRGWKRLNFIANSFTLIGYCRENGRLDFGSRGPVSAQTAGLTPWYRQAERQTTKLNIIFSDDIGFADGVFPGIYPLPATGQPVALKLSTNPEMIVG